MKCQFKFFYSPLMIMKCMKLKEFYSSFSVRNGLHNFKVNRCAFGNRFTLNDDRMGSKKKKVLYLVFMFVVKKMEDIEFKPTINFLQTSRDVNFRIIHSGMLIVLQDKKQTDKQTDKRYKFWSLDVIKFISMQCFYLYSFL